MTTKTATIEETKKVAAAYRQWLLENEYDDLNQAEAALAINVLEFAKQEEAQEVRDLLVSTLNEHLIKVPEGNA